MKSHLQLKILPETLAISRLSPNDEIPTWAASGSFFSFTRTADELSIVCEQAHVPTNVKCEKDWRCLKVKGPLDFGLTGILASLASPLAEAKISIFAVSTFDTDYLLIKQENLKKALTVLNGVGHEIL
jgi:hypothetical protein